MRLGGDLDFHHGILVAVFPFHGVATLGVHARTREEGEVAAGVGEDHAAVFGVSGGFHEES